MNAQVNSTWPAQLLVEKTFSMSDQVRFADLSGDRNPIHLDPLAARRSLAKEPVVHGIQTALWAIDAFCAGLPTAPPILGLKVRFEAMVPVGGAVQAWLISRSERAARIDILHAGRTAAVVLLSFGEPTQETLKFNYAPLPFLDKPLEHPFAEIATGAAVRLPPKDGLAAAFPNAARNLGPNRLRGLAATSYVVGMVCPGRWSIYRALSVTATPKSESASVLSFQVANIDLRFRLVQCTIEGAGWTGSFDAHVAPEPVAQPTMSEVSKSIRPGEFAGIKALVVGGSRGLGELVSKLLAAGDAEVELTYQVGRDDALRVLDEIRAAGGRGGVRRLDVLQNPAPLADPFDFHQVYYMAAPPIVKAPPGEQAALTRAYEAVFVDGFARLCRRLAELPHSRLSIFYASSVFVEETPYGFEPYARAKRAGERICEALQASMPTDRILMRRLPALPTDQTQSLLHRDFSDGISVMLPIVRAMRN